MNQKSDPRRDTREQVRDLYAAFVPVKDIARQLRITPQRVYQHLAALRKENGQ